MKLLKLVLAAMLLLAPSAAYCHPHIFISAEFQVVANNDRTIMEMRNVWYFDDVFSSSVLLDFDKNADLALDKTELKSVGDTVRASMADYDYYTNVTENGRKITISKPSVIDVEYKDGFLVMRFSVKPKTKMPLKGRMVFGIYDKTLYTAVDFAKDADMKVVGSDFKACTTKVVRPDPEQIIAQNQTSLTDMFFNDPTGTNMQALTATRLEVNCP